MGTAFEDLAGVDVGDTLFVGDPWKMDREAPFQCCIRLEELNKKILTALNVHLTFVGDLKGGRSRRKC